MSPLSLFQLKWVGDGSFPISLVFFFFIFLLLYKSPPIIPILSRTLKPFFFSLNTVRFNLLWHPDPWNGPGSQHDPPGSFHRGHSVETQSNPHGGKTIKWASRILVLLVLGWQSLFSCLIFRPPGGTPESEQKHWWFFLICSSIHPQGTLPLSKAFCGWERGHLFWILP